MKNIINPMYAHGAVTIITLVIVSEVVGTGVAVWAIGLPLAAVANYFFHKLL